MPSRPAPKPAAPLDAFHVRLLEEIAATGSITRAAAACGVSYRTAWTHVDRLNGLSEHPLVERAAGGASGGGTRLTEHGKAVLRRLALRTSARNQFFGVITAVRKTALEAEVSLRLQGGDALRARITRRSAEELGIRKGLEVFALVKANWVRALPLPRESRRDRRIPGNSWKAVAEVVERSGSRVEVGARLPGGERLWISGDNDAVAAREGFPIRLEIDPSNVILGVP